MDANGGYVVAGYTITTVTLVAYVLWLRQRTRRVRRSLDNENS
jgi:hypothetical protein